MIARKRPKIDLKKKVGGISFFIAIPLLIIAGGCALLTVLLICSKTNSLERAPLFFFGFLCFLLFSFALRGTIGVFLHEIKHALIVLGTGNRLQEIKVQEDTGHVAYRLYTENLHFAPIIVLAPYFWPLFSLPALLGCLLLEKVVSLDLLSFVLGAALAVDLVSAFQDMGPQQTDFKVIRGGIVSAGLYLAAFHFFWLSFCALWTVGGREGFVLFLFISWQILQKLAKNLFVGH